MTAATFFFFIYTRYGDRPVDLAPRIARCSSCIVTNPELAWAHTAFYGPRILKHKGELANTQKPRDGCTPADAFAGTAAPGGEKVTGRQGDMAPLGEGMAFRMPRVRHGQPQIHKYVRTESGAAPGITT